MLALKVKSKNQNILSQGQNRLLRESLKRLLGPGLVQTQPQRTEREEKALFLKEALNSKILNSEWFS
jgi:hypothetical protein